MSTYNHSWMRLCFTHLAKDTAMIWGWNKCVLPNFPPRKGLLPTYGRVLQLFAPSGSASATETTSWCRALPGAVHISDWVRWGSKSPSIAAWYGAFWGASLALDHSLCPIFVPLLPFSIGLSYTSYTRFHLGIARHLPRKPNLWQHVKWITLKQFQFWGEDDLSSIIWE